MKLSLIKSSVLIGAVLAVGLTSAAMAKSQHPVACSSAEPCFLHRGQGGKKLMPNVANKTSASFYYGKGGGYARGFPSPYSHAWYHDHQGAYCLGCQ